VQLRELIKIRMDELQSYMESNSHIDNRMDGLKKISIISKYWGVLDEETRDYVHAAQTAIEDQTEWNV
jgi:hypothetical protein